MLGLAQGRDEFPINTLSPAVGSRSLATRAVGAMALVEGDGHFIPSGPKPRSCTYRVATSRTYRVAFRASDHAGGSMTIENWLLIFVTQAGLGAKQVLWRDPLQPI